MSATFRVRIGGASGVKRRQGELIHRQARVRRGERNDGELHDLPGGGGIGRLELFKRRAAGKRFVRPFVDQDRFPFRPARW